MYSPLPPPQVPTVVLSHQTSAVVLGMPLCRYMNTLSDTNPESQTNYSLNQNLQHHPQQHHPQQHHPQQLRPQPQYYNIDTPPTAYASHETTANTERYTHSPVRTNGDPTDSFRMRATTRSKDDRDVVSRTASRQPCDVNQQDRFHQDMSHRSNQTDPLEAEISNSLRLLEQERDREQREIYQLRRTVDELLVTNDKLNNSVQEKQSGIRHAGMQLSACRRQTVRNRAPRHGQKSSTCGYCYSDRTRK
eukprot:GHVQ01019469.1.p1 GENE.GHVQ01019469.1~~GHVQ01019469.1.p1  ORF type:complete len:248 (+),score=43.26 GHVQ01019469.1:43-786(+)